MSRRRSRSPEEPGLFDLPLDPPSGAEPDESATRAPEPEPAEAEEERPEPLPLFEAPRHRLEVDAPPRTRPPRPPAPTGAHSNVRPEPAPERAGNLPVSLSARYLAGLVDLAAHAALAVLLLAGARLLGVPAGLGDAPALVAFLLVFSFLYTVVPLAFWGRTPGMSWAGIVARTAAGESLTFGQTVRRWAGGLLSVLLLGLPTLLAAAGGPSLADRLSDSVLLPS